MEVKRRAIIYVEWSSVLCAFWFDVFILNDLSHLTYFDLYLCMWCKPALLQPSKHWWSAFEVSSSETGQFAGLFCSLGLCQLSNGSASLTYMVKELWYVFGLSSICKGFGRSEFLLLRSPPNPISSNNVSTFGPFVLSQLIIAWYLVKQKEKKTTSFCIMLH